MISVNSTLNQFILHDFLCKCNHEICLKRCYFCEKRLADLHKKYPRRCPPACLSPRTEVKATRESFRHSDQSRLSNKAGKPDYKSELSQEY